MKFGATNGPWRASARSDRTSCRHHRLFLFLQTKQRNEVGSAGEESSNSSVSRFARPRRRIRRVIIGMARYPYGRCETLELYVSPRGVMNYYAADSTKQYADRHS